MAQRKITGRRLSHFLSPALIACYSFSSALILMIFWEIIWFSEIGVSISIVYLSDEKQTESSGYV